MNNSPISAIHELHRTGHYLEAKQGYLDILQKQPNNAEVLHALGIVHVQLGEFEEAVEYLQTALEIEPNNLPLHLNLANAFKMQNLSNEAIKILQTAIKLNPNYSAAYNNLGTIYYGLGNIEEAIKNYKLAISNQPNYIDAYYNLGLAFTKQKNIDEAITTYKTLLSYSPQHAAASFQLGTLFLAASRLQEAEKQFLFTEELQPFHLETQTNLATCYLKLGALTEAKNHYLKALEISPQDTQVLFNLGVISMQQSLIDNAIQYYQRVIQITPDVFAVHNNIAVAFLEKQHIGFALHHFREALRLDPHNKAIDYTIKMLAQDQRLLASPPEYIKNLFDSYADHYELHLLQGLEYKLPQLLFNAVSRVTKEKNPKWDILDLGCGTGLCGVVFKPYANSLTGIDLSPNMLEIAAQKNIYSELIQSDLQSGLADKLSAYDLVIAGDVFVYIGDLQAIFSSVKKALREKGLFAFNTEMTEAADFTINQSGRFSHQKKYIDQLAAEHHFKILYYDKVITRQQNNAAVNGHLYVLQRTSL